MNKVALMILSLLALASAHQQAFGQRLLPSPAIAEEQKSRNRPAHPPPPRQATRSDHAQAAPFTLKLERGSKITVNNRFGQITITGWDSDVLEARATGDDGPEAVDAKIEGDPLRANIILFVKSAMEGHHREVDFDIKLPRYALIEPIELIQGEVRVTGVNSAIAISAGNGEVSVSNVGSLKATAHNGEISAKGITGDVVARTMNGEISIENAGSFVEAATANGSIFVRDVRGDVRAATASGEVEIHCAKGRADVSAASGSVTLIGVGGDAEASTVGGEVIFRGAIRPGGRYSLKTLSGDIEMAVQNEPPGFTAALSSYNGEIETDFKLESDTPLQGGAVARRIIGRYGDGKARIDLDSFSGVVRITRAKAGAMKDCKQ